MSRLGMSPDEVGSLDPDAFDGLDLKLVMSHLACADEPENPANERQRQAFDALRAMLPPAPASLANSSGIFLGEALPLRPRPAGRRPLRRQPDAGTGRTRCGRWSGCEAKVIQTRDLLADMASATVMPTGQLRRCAPATIALGYADGWPRRAAASALVRRRAAAVRRPRLDGQHHPRHLRARRGPASGRAISSKLIGDRPDRRRCRRTIRHDRL